MGSNLELCKPYGVKRNPAGSCPAGLLFFVYLVAGLLDPGFAAGHQPLFSAKPDVLQVARRGLVEAAASVAVNVRGGHAVELRDQAVVVGEGCLCIFVFLTAFGVVQHGILEAPKEPVASVVDVSVSLLLPGVAF